MSLNVFCTAYFIFISLFSVFITIADKYNSKHRKKRVPEDFLLTIGLLGGAAAQYITMVIIRHKTRHKKFMLGLPAEIIIQMAMLILVYFHIKH